MEPDKKEKKGDKKKKDKKEHEKYDKIKTLGQGGFGTAVLVKC